MFTVANTAVDEPAADARAHRVVCTPKDVAGFSATAYFFGRDLSGSDQAAGEHLWCELGPDGDSAVDQFRGEWTPSR